MTLVLGMRKDDDRFLRAVIDGGCQRALQKLWNNQGLRNTILTWNDPVLDENMLYSFSPGNAIYWDMQC